jgi:tripartite-type tricarboxylate transporter receptor subunit TctC
MESGVITKHLRLWAVVVVTAIWAAGPDRAWAQAFPAKPVRLVIPYAPGGASDFTGREVARKLTEAWKQQVVVDNRDGAAGAIGHGFVAKAQPDGYTLLLGTFGGLVSGPALLGSQATYDPVKDFAPIGMAVYIPVALVVHPSVPAKTVRELVDLAAGNPGKLNYASMGVGTPNHLGMVLLTTQAKIDMVHVPYRGTTTALVDIMSGQVQSLFSGIPQILPHVRSGKLRAIGVGHPTRLNALPDVPAIAETVPGFNNTGYYGLLGPAGTPNALVKQINEDLRRSFSGPELAKRLDGHGLLVTASSPQQFHEAIRDDLALWRKVIKTAGITPGSAQ